MKNENRENLPRMCRRDHSEYRACHGNWHATAGRAIENKDGTGVLYCKETESRFQESRCEIQRARGNFTGSNARKQGRVGAGHHGRRERRDALRAERRQVFCASFEYEVFTTALALAKLGPDFRFHTTLETPGT